MWEVGVLRVTVCFGSVQLAYFLVPMCNAQGFEGVHTCTAEDSLDSIITKIVSAKVRGQSPPIW